MTRSELIAEITAFYTVVGSIRETTSTDTSVPDTIKNYEVLVYETGISEQSRKPVLRSKVINFITYMEGQPEETAYYYENELTNDVDTDVVGTGTLSNIHKIYISESIRGRVQAAVALSAEDILNESMPLALLSGNATAGQNTINVESSNIFWIGKTILLFDSNNSEELSIIGITGNTLIFASSLIHSYTTANGATARYLNNAERQQWATNALINPDSFTLCMTSLVSLSSVIQAAGGLATDNDIRTVVNSFINKVASSCYL